MEEKEIRPTSARIIGNVLPAYTELMKETSYEDYHVIREFGTPISYKGVTNNSLKLFLDSHDITFNTDVIGNWLYEKIYANSTLTDADKVAPTVNNNGVADMGVAYLTVYRTPLFNTSDTTMNACTLKIVLEYNYQYQNVLLGILNSAHNNITGYDRKLNDIIHYDTGAVHTLEFKFRNGVGFVFVDGGWIGHNINLTGSVGDCVIGFYNAGSDKAVKIHDIQLIKEVTLDPTPLNIRNTNCWSSVVNPTRVNDSNSTDFSVTSNGLNIGCYYYCYWDNWNVPRNTNKRTFKVHMTSGTNFQVGFMYDDNGTPVVKGFNTSYDLPGASSVYGEHEFIFTSNNNSKWTAMLDGEYTQMTPKTFNQNTDNPFYFYLYNFDASNSFVVDSIDVIDGYCILLDGVPTYYDTIVADENSTDNNWVLTNWTGGTGTRTVNSNHQLELGTNTRNYYNPFPDEDFVAELNVEQVGGNNEQVISFYNDAIGRVTIVLGATSTQIRVFDTGNNRIETFYKDHFTTTTNRTNTIRFIRNGTKLHIEYYSINAEKWVRYTRNYGTKWSNAGRLLVGTNTDYNGNWKINQFAIYTKKK